MKSCPCTVSFPWLTVLGNLYLAHGSVINWAKFIGVSGGGITLTVDGMTTVTDAGAAGLPPIQFNSAINAIYMGDYGTYGVLVYNGSGIYLNALNSRISMLANGGITFGVTTPAYTEIVMGGNGWLLAKGVSGDDRSEFINTDWAAAEAPGVKWITSDVLAPARVAARGGVWRKSTDSTTPSFWKGLSQVYSARDAYRVYARFAMQQIANCRFAVGVCDDVPAAAPNSLPHTAEGIYACQDDAVGANYLLRQVTGAAVVDDDSAIAIVAGEYHVINVLVAATRIPTLYIDGTLRVTGAAADSPPAATLLRKVIYADNIAGAILAQVDVDVYDIVCSRNTAVTP